MKAAFLFPLLLGVAAAGCTRQPPRGDAATAAPAGAAVSCIDLNQVVGRRPEPPRFLVFEMIGGKTYRNEVQGSCPSLQRAMGTETLQFEPFAGGRLCRDDGVRVYDPVEARAGGPQSFPRCRLGSFTPVAGR
jgi:hypothetical protein